MAVESRPVRAFVLHGRTGRDLLDYEEFFAWVASLPRHATRVQVTQDLVLAIEKALSTSSGFHLRFVSGNPNEVPLLYVEETGETITEEVSVGRWRAVATRVAVHPSNRLLAIELRRAGVGATNLERYFSRLAKDNDFDPRLSLDMNPLPSPSFALELEEFERIREASIVVRRPNTDWDDADDVLSQLADDSRGHQASVTVNAGRGESLAPNRGIVGLIHEHIVRPLANVANVRVTGNQPGSDKERTVSLARHQMQTRALVQRGTSLSEEDETIFATEDELLERGAEVVANLRDLNPSEDE